MNTRRLVAALGLAVAAALGTAGTTLAHPLGNYTVNRAVAVTLTHRAAAVRYVIDMAEIPAFAALQAMDLDADGATEPDEERAWADATCEASRAAVVAEVDGGTLTLVRAGDPVLAFPAGAGGLETLRLVCPLAGAWALAAGEHRVAIVDRTDDGHVGWREVTIAAAGWTLLSSDVSAVSPSEQLTAYPTDTLAAPPDVRSGKARLLVDEASVASDSATAPTDGPRSTSNDPFASVIAGELTPPVALLALLVAAALGAVHALSPGHGKTLVAAYLIGSQGTLPQAAGLGMTVAVTHTFGVFALGAVALAAGELFIPERVIAWLSVVSGALVVLLGVGLVWRALHSAGSRSQHDHDNVHGEEHAHPHPHRHRHAGGPPSVSVRGLLALGLAGGMVPSASALIVLLAAVSSGRLLFGIGLIVAFGVGMATVLAGLAAATTLLRRTIVAPGTVGSWPLAGRVIGLLPVASGVAVLVIGGVVTLAALARIG